LVANYGEKPVKKKEPVNISNLFNDFKRMELADKIKEE